MLDADWIAATAMGKSRYVTARIKSVGHVQMRINSDAAILVDRQTDDARRRWRNTEADHHKIGRETLSVAEHDTPHIRVTFQRRDLAGETELDTTPLVQRGKGGANASTEANSRMVHLPSPPQSHRAHAHAGSLPPPCR